MIASEEERSEWYLELKQKKDVEDSIAKVKSEIVRLQEAAAKKRIERDELNQRLVELEQIESNLIRTSLPSPRENQLSALITELSEDIHQINLMGLRVRSRRQEEISKMQDRLQGMIKERESLQALRLLPDSGLNRAEAQSQGGDQESPKPPRRIRRSAEQAT